MVCRDMASMDTPHLFVYPEFHGTPNRAPNGRQLGSCIQDDPNVWVRKQQKRQRTAALQNLAEGVARNPPRQRLGVRLSSAALTNGPPANERRAKFRPAS